MGWTLELIANSTGGRIPKYWRPPYGDTDLRVSAIAREVRIISFKHHLNIKLLFLRLGVQFNNGGLEWRVSFFFFLYSFFSLMIHNF